MLTGWETVPSAFVATAWANRARWGAVLQDVRLLTVGLVAAGAGPGRRIAVADDLTLELAVLAAGSVAVLDGSGADLEVPADVVEQGRRIDAEEPDAFERAWGAVHPEQDAVVAGALFSHANLVAAVRSLALATGLGVDGVVHVELPLTAPAAHFLAPLTGAAVGGPGPATVVLRPPSARTALGYAGVVSIDGCPLPGVTMAIADDGSTRIRSEAVAVGALVEGWLPA